MSALRLALLTTLTMIAFAANSIFCRMALKQTSIDAASFTAVRLLAGATMLLLLMRLQNKAPLRHGSWRSALALFIYAAALSFAYRSINTGAGALMLFGAVQATMILAGYLAGERMSALQTLGFVAALSGLVILVSPGVQAPSLLDSLIMLLSGVAWGMYSLWGSGQPDAAAATAGNFLRAVPLTLLLSLLASPWMTWDSHGVLYAVLSGALTSALGYVLWYKVLQQLRAMTASTIQLSAPLLAALGGIVLLGEAFTRDLLIASLLILGGIFLVVRQRKR
jgi:drug/metabolite transporter (DMT)-like permease